MPKCKLPKSIILHVRKLNCKVCVHELKSHVGEKALNLNLPSKIGPTKKTLLASIPSHLLKNA